MSRLCPRDPQDGLRGSPSKQEDRAKKAFGPHLWKRPVPPWCRSGKAHVSTWPMQRQVFSVTHGCGSGRLHARFPQPGFGEENTYRDGKRQLQLLQGKDISPHPRRASARRKVTLM